MSTRWALVTGEYPPQPGGVADYSALVAGALAAHGDEVTVFAPRCPDPAPARPGVRVERLPDHFGPRGLLALDYALAKLRPDRVLVQYVPHAYGLKALNVPFAAWVAARARAVAPVWVMFHEVNFPFAWRPTHALLYAAHAVMARLVAGCAERAFVSVPAWAARLRRLVPWVAEPEWLPVPCNVAVLPGRRAIAADGQTIGHFGTYGGAVVPLLEPALARLLTARPDRVALLLGRGGPEFLTGFLARNPELNGRLAATGDLSAEHVAQRLRGCDLALQPYIDGISARRTSAMAALANGVPVASNLGPLAEPLWGDLGWPGLAPAPDADQLTVAAERVLALPAEERESVGRAGADLYRARFSLDNTIRALRAGGATAP